MVILRATLIMGGHEMKHTCICGVVDSIPWLGLGKRQAWSNATYHSYVHLLSSHN
jgi:hypothetical protein